MDKYDEAIEYLVRFPSKVLRAWNSLSYASHCLFQFCTPTGGIDFRPQDNNLCGCLTHVVGYDGVAWSDELARAIRDDGRLHGNVNVLAKQLAAASPDERRQLLQPYAEWQRRMDVEIRGKVKS